MPDLFTLTGPIFALIGLGWLAVSQGWFGKEQLPALGRFVVAFCLPALLWRALGQRNLAEVANWRYLSAYTLGSLTVFGLGWMWERARGGRRTPAAMTALGMSNSNSAYVGYPVALQLVGPEATVALALTMLVENFLMIPLALALADVGTVASGTLGLRGSFRVAGQALWGLRRSTIVMGIAAGLLTSLTRSAFGWELPVVVDRAVAPLAGAATAVSLFYIGGSLVGLQLGELRVHVAAVAVGKLVLHPLAVAAALLLVGPVAMPLQWSAVLLAAAPMLSIYPILGQRYKLQAVNAACLLGATLGAFATLGAVVGLLKLGWGAPH